jgi:hypothetical protein
MVNVPVICPLLAQVFPPSVEYSISVIGLPLADPRFASILIPVFPAVAVVITGADGTLAASVFFTADAAPTPIAFTALTETG